MLPLSWARARTKSSWLAAMVPPEAQVLGHEPGQDVALEPREAVRGHHQTFPQQPALSSMAVSWKATN